MFQNEENSFPDKTLTSKVGDKTTEKTRESESSSSRPGSTQIFRPTPSCEPAKHLGTDAGLDVETAQGLSSLKAYAREKERKEVSDHINREIDLNSTSNYKAFGSSLPAASGNIDLSATVRRPSRNLILQRSSADVKLDHSVSHSVGVNTGSNNADNIGATIGDNSGVSTVSRIGGNIGASTSTSINTNIGASSSANTVANIGSNTGASIDLSDTAPRPGTLVLHGDTLDSDSSPGIDLSGTVPNLEGLLALHGSSTVDTRTGSKIDLSKTVLKHGRSWKHLSTLRGSGSNTDRGVTESNRGSSLGSDSGPSIDLNETVPQPGGSRTTHEFASLDLKESQAPNLNRPSAAGSVVSRLNRDVLHPQLHLVKTEPDQNEERMPPGKNTEMMDLNFSTKLLGVPHSVVTPFNATMPQHTKPSRELTKSPSEFSGKSSVLSSPRSHVPSSPKSQARRISTTSPSPADHSPGSTISLPSLSLDLSRFNLPPEVRKALADRYSGKKGSGSTSSHSVEAPEGRRSQPLFSEHKPERTFDQGIKASPLPARLRGRAQRSVSLDSPIVRRENVEGTSQSGLLERGNIFDTHKFLNMHFNNDGHQSTGLSSLDNIPAVSITAPSLGVLVPSTKVPPFGVTTVSASSHTSAPKQQASDELQSRGLIDLSSTSYLEEMSVRRPTDASRLTVDNLRSPPRPPAPQGRGLIDLNVSVEYRAREAPVESLDAQLSVMKRKRLNSSDTSENVSSLGDEKTVKRPKQGEARAGNDKAVTYRSGINVQELLTIEREEQNQLQNLHAVQSRLKSVRAQIQKLCTELDSLSSDEQRISLRMGELRNMRLGILESACYERQGLPGPGRIEAVPTRDTGSTTTQGFRDDNRMSTVSSETGIRTNNDDTFGNFRTKIGDNSINSPQEDTSCINVVKSPLRDYCEVGKDTEHIDCAERFDGDSSACSNSELPLHANSSSNITQSGVKFASVGTATKFVLREETSLNKQTQEKVQERLTVAPRLTMKGSKSCSGETRRANIAVQTSGTQTSVTSRDLIEDIPERQQVSVVSRFAESTERSAVTAPEIVADPSSPNRSKCNENSNVQGLSKVSKKRSRKESLDKAKHFHPTDKSLFRKKSFSDVNVSKTIEASRKKIQSVRENMKRWKQHQEGIDVLESHEEKLGHHSSSFPSSSCKDGVEIVSEIPCKEKHVPSPCKIPIQDKPSPRKTTKELKKSSLFHSGKKRSKESRKHRAEKSQRRDKESKEIEELPSKRRKVGDTLCNPQFSVSSKKKTSPKGKGQVVSAAAHTTTADLGGSGTEERPKIGDEIPTRDVVSKCFLIASLYKVGRPCSSIN